MDTEAAEAGDALMEVCTTTLGEWQVDRQYAGGELGSVAVYGVPDSWPHIRALYGRHGFAPEGHIEIILVACVEELPSAIPAPVAGLVLQRSVGDCGTRFSALLDGDRVGLIEVEMRADGDQRTRQFGWSDIGNLWVKDELRRRGIGTYLLGAASDWLRLGGIQRLIAYARPAEEDELAFLRGHAFRELVRTERGWARPGGSAISAEARPVESAEA